MNRGSEHVHQGLHRLGRASMRPRFMNRGSDHLISAALERDPRFNEAPIHESGKCCPTDPNPRHPVRFNEAPIHESGKLCNVKVGHRRVPLLQ